jgi:hypothetical protein
MFSCVVIGRRIVDWAPEQAAQNGANAIVAHKERA